MGTIFNIQKFCIHDGDGVRTMVFLKGCPLRCAWCHNPESLDRNPCMSFTDSRCTACGRCTAVCNGRTIVDGKLVIDRSMCNACGKCVEACLNNACEILGYEMSAEDVFAEVIKDKMFYDSTGGGMTVSGGEPSYQAEFTLTLLKMAKDAGIGRAVESCGIGKAEFYREAAELGTVFLFDIKAMDPILHKELTGADNAHILSNLKMLFDLGADVIIRMPMVPSCNDSDEEIALRAAFLKENEGKYRYAEIMPYHTLGVGKSKKIGQDVKYKHDAATEADIARWIELFEKGGVSVKVSR